VTSRSSLPFALLLLSLGFACGGAGLPPEAIEHNTAGAELLAGGELDAAEARFHLALEYHPRFSEPRANLGVVALERGQLDRAEEHLRGALELEPDFAEAWGDLGVVLERKGRTAEARAAYERGLSVNPGLVGPRRNLAFLHAREGRFGEARAQLLRLAQVDPTDAEAGGLLAYCELRLDRPTAAAERAAAVLAEAPDAPMALAVRGVVRAHARDLDGAAADLRGAGEDPVVGRHARVRLAAVLLLRGECPEARRLVETLLDDDPTDAAARLVKGRADTICR
jgi:Flp pilus assembly protein TadD